MSLVSSGSVTHRVHSIVKKELHEDIILVPCPVMKSHFSRWSRQITSPLLYVDINGM